MNTARTQLVTVFGGSGFIGRHLVRALAKRGYRVRAAVRRPELARFLQPMGGVGQIHAVQANLRYPESIARAVEGADAVVNLVGILAEKGEQTFDRVQAGGAAAVAQAAAAAGIGRFVQMSAIGADARSASAYARSKAAGEMAAQAAVPGAVVVRPSVVFGPEDSFFNRFAAVARLAPVIPLVGAGTRFQPVFVGDVAEAIARAVDGNAQAGAVYELGGPEVMTMRQLFEYVLKVTERERILYPISFEWADKQARLLETLNSLTFGLLPEEFSLTRDQVTLLELDNVVSQAAIDEGRTLVGLGIEPEIIEAVVPSYLVRFRKTGQFDRRRIA
jgi:uncharacterized protein YbjT (DUF2867 family)